MEKDPTITLEDAVDKVDRYLRIALRDIITIYRSGICEDVFPIKKKADIETDRIIVWVFWMQGFQNAPDIVKLCRESWYRHLSSDVFRIIEVTEENYRDYIELPGIIQERAADGRIATAHFSDILRFNLLYLYGGLWLDATCFLVNEVRGLLAEENAWFTLRHEKPMWKGDFSMGEWSGNLLKLPAGNLIARFFLNAEFYYFLEHDSPIHYFQIDAIIRIAKNELPEVRRMLEAVPFSQPEYMKLQEKLNEPYSDREWKELIEKTDVFKLSYKDELRREDENGAKTFFGKLME